MRINIRKRLNIKVNHSSLDVKNNMDNTLSRTYTSKMMKRSLILNLILITFLSATGNVRAELNVGSNDKITDDKPPLDQDKSLLPWMADSFSNSTDGDVKNEGLESSVEKKLREASKAIHKSRYNAAIAKCEEVLRIDPNNSTAIGRMGTAFYLLKENDKAITLWKRALELEPNNEPAMRFVWKIMKKKKTHSLNDLH